MFFLLAENEAALWSSCCLALLTQVYFCVAFSAQQVLGHTAILSMAMAQFLFSDCPNQ
jgi:hypothetical protein